MSLGGLRNNMPQFKLKDITIFNKYMNWKMSLWGF